jgi:hypothetical protein
MHKCVTFFMAPVVMGLDVPCWRPANKALLRDPQSILSQSSPKIFHDMIHVFLP